MLRVSLALPILAAATLTALATDVNAQEAPEAAPRDGGASSAEPEPVSYSMASLRDLRSVPSLEARDAVLTHRLRAYGFGLLAAGALVVGGGLLASSYAQNFCDDCEGTPNRFGLGRLGWGLLGVGAVAIVAGIPSLFAAAARRRTGRRRIHALRLTPVVSLSPRGTTGGATLQLTW